MSRAYLVAPMVVVALWTEPHAAEIAVAWNDFDAGTDVVRAISSNAPWNFVSDSLIVGRNSVLRAAEGRLYALSRTDDSLTVIDPRTWTIDRTYPLTAGSEALDIALASNQIAYLTRQNATHLLRLNLSDGSSSEVLDLSAFADDDGIPDLGTMTVHDDRLFVQIQRRNFEGPQVFDPPAYLAVMDLETEQLVDADTQLPGVQAIELVGTAPKLRMQVVPETQQLFVGATGTTFDAGGLEIVSLEDLTSQGLVVHESDGTTGADLGPFVMVTPQRGFLATTTDLLPSSHLHMFSLAGVEPEQLEVAVDYLAPAIEFDPKSNSIFFPYRSGIESGLYVFDATTGHRLSQDLIAIDGQPTDITLVPEVSAGWLLVVGALTSVVARRRGKGAGADREKLAAPMTG